ncbi:MAG: hypothetical protein R3293_19705, partial [Candidatus Promineifilaceae bacterium]|nr:hypothetical protein [Candidatus Promineifilaceae bacterium]
MTDISRDENSFPPEEIENQPQDVAAENHVEPRVDVPSAQISRQETAVDPEDETGQAPLVEETTENISHEGEAEPPSAGAENEETDSADEGEFDPLRALTSLLLGGAIEGTSQLVRRLETYEAEVRRQEAERAAEAHETDSVPEEDELDRLRYAFVGFVLDAQDTFRRNVGLWARFLDRSARATNRVAKPVS